MFARLFRSRRSNSQCKPLRLTVEHLETRLAPAVVRWITNADGNWNDCGSWRVDGTNPPVFRCPGAEDDAVIDVGVDALITFTGNHQVRTVNVAERLRMTSGTLTIGGAAPLTSTLNRLDQSSGAVLNVLTNTQLTLSATHSLNGTINVGAGAALSVANFTLTGTINAAATATVSFYGCGDMLLQPGAAFSGAGTYTLLGNVFCGPRLTLNRDVTVQNLEVNTNGGISGAGALTVTNTLTFRSGEIGGTGTVTLPAGSTLNVIEHHVKTLNSRTLNLSGTANWRDARSAVGFANSAVFNNLASGTVNLLNDTEFLYGNGTFNNAGTLNKTQMQEPGLSTTGTRFNNTGTINVRSGILQIYGQGTTSGRIQADVGATFELFYGNNQGPFAIDPGATFTGAGTFRLDGNGNGRVVLNTDVSIPTFVMEESVIVGTGNLTIGAGMTWNGGVIGGSGALTIPAGITLALGGNRDKALDGTRTLNNTGTILFDATRRFGLAQGATLNNSGTFIIAGGAGIDSYLYDFSPPGTINNTGAWLKTSEGVTVINVIFNTSTPVSVGAGELRLQRGGASSSSFELADGASLAITGGTYNFDAGAVVNGGSLRIDNGSLSLNTDLTVAVMSMERDSGLTGAGALNVVGSLTWNRGTMRGTGTTTIIEGAVLTLQSNDQKAIEGTRTLNIAGSATWTDGGHFFLNGTAASVNLSGAFTIENDRILQGNGRLVNTGTLTKTSGGVTTFEANFDNRGTVSVAAGQLALRGGASSGVFDLSAEAVVAFVGGTHRLEAGTLIQGEGTAAVAGGTVMLDGADVTALNFSLQSGTVDGAGTLTVTRLLDWTGGQMANIAGKTRIGAGALLSLNGNGVRTLSGRIVEVAGTMSWIESGNLNVFSNGTFDILPGGYLEVNNATDLTMSGAGIINNAGLIVKVGQAQLNLSGITVNDNGGQLVLQEGVLNVVGRYIVNSGSTEIYSTLIATGGVELRGGGLFLGGGQITGNVALTERDAIFSGFGTVTGNLANGGQVNVGGVGAAGTLTVGGNFTQTSIGVLNLELGGVTQGLEYDFLDVRGTAALDGILNISFINEYFPSVGDSFRVLEALRGRTGTFARINVPELGDQRLDPSYDANGLTFTTL